MKKALLVGALVFSVVALIAAMPSSTWRGADTDMADTDGAIMDTRPITATATVATPVADTAMADEVGEDLAA